MKVVNRDWVPAEIHSTQPGGVVVVGRDPGTQEVQYRFDEFTGIAYPHGRPFVGPAGQAFEQCASAGGFRRQDFAAITNVIGAQPYDNDFKRHPEEDVQEGLKRLSKLLSRLKPSLVITLGNEAAYALLGDVWPTAGRGIYGAKSIEDRRGYFWWSDRYDCWVLTAGHPAAALRKAVPGYYLLETDFRRARRWLDGDLPREQLPEAKRLDTKAAQRLLRHDLLACDIETKWGGGTVEMVGYCGDDLVPYVAWTQRAMSGPSRMLLESAVWKCFHNGPFDYFLLKNDAGITIKNYIHDTMHAWQALEPELAGREETGEDDTVGRGGRLTRKGLGFLPTIMTHNVATNVAWWKDYPNPETDPDYLEKMVQLNAIDAWMTRRLADWLLAAVIKEEVWDQYWVKRDMQAVCYDMQYRGLHVNEELRAERERLLVEREEAKKQQSTDAALKFIEKYDVKEFELWKQCTCCGGGKVSKDHCWRCGGLEEKPARKDDYLPLMDAKGNQKKRDQLKQYKVAELLDMLPPCETCGGVGKTMTYEFNPFSPAQLITLLNGPIGAPASTYRGKVQMDEAAMRKVLVWANAGGAK